MKIYSASTPPEAHIVCELLKSHQISCEVRGEGVFSLQGEIPFGEASEPYVWLLDEEKAEQATEVVRLYTNDNNGADWQCTQCGESNEGQFAICWQCEASAP